MSNQERGTGRTQRGVVQAVAQLLMGRSGLHISATPNAARDARTYASRWLRENGFMDQTTIVVKSSATVIRFGTAKLEFMHMASCLQGLRPDYTIKDHFVLECEAEAAVLAEKEADKNTIARLMHKHQWGTIEGYGVQFHGGMVQRAKLRLNLVKRTAE